MAISMPKSAFDLGVVLSVDMTNFKRDMKAAVSSVRSAGKSMMSAGRTMTTNVTLPAAAMGAAVLKTAADFEASMLRVKAVSGATGEQFQALQAQARQLGSTTQFSASQAAEGMNFLAMAGFETDKIIGAMPSTLNLAAAAQLDMGSAADIVSNIMAGFNMETQELGGAVDVLAKQFTSSNTDLRQLGEAMKFVAPVAEGLGFSFEETSAAVGLLSNAGLQAGQAGRGLRMTLRELGKKSEELGFAARDAAGNMLPLNQILDNMKAAGVTAETAMKEFSANSATALTVLLKQGGGALRDQTALLNQAGGTAQELADIRMKGLSGELKKLRSAAEELALAIADSGLLDFVTNLVQNVTSWVRQLAKASPKTFRFASALLAFGAVAGPLVAVIGGIATGIAAIASPVPAVIAGIAALALGINYIAQNWEAVKERISDWSWWQNTLVSMLQFIVNYNPFGLLIKEINAVISFFGKDPIPDPFAKVAEGLEDLKTETKDYEHEFGSVTDSIKDGVKDFAGMMGGISFGGLFDTSGGGSGGAGATQQPQVQQPETTSNLQTGGFAGAAVEQTKEMADELARADANVRKLGQTMLQTGEKSSVFAQITQTLKAQVKGLSQQIGQGLVNAFSNMILGAENSFAQFVEMLKKLIVRLLVTAAIAAALSALLPGIFGGGGALSAGGGASGFSSAFKLLGGGGGAMPFASGGIVSGPTNALIGEYPGAKNNPEVVAPLDKLQSMMGGQSVQVNGKIQGKDIVLSSERSKRSRTRRRGF